MILVFIFSSPSSKYFAVLRKETHLLVLSLLALQPLLWKLSLDICVKHPVFDNSGKIDDSSYAYDAPILVDVDGEPENIIK